MEDPTPADVPFGEPCEPEPEPTQQLPVGAEQEPELEPEAALNGAPRRRAKRERSGLSLPTIPARLAVVVTGLLVGAAGGAATFGAMAGCEAVRGVSTCGGAPGFFILLAIVVLMILLGGMLLKAFKVSDPGSTSFLAVGVVTVVTMLALLDVIYSPSDVRGDPRAHRSCVPARPLGHHPLRGRAGRSSRLDLSRPRQADSLRR